MGIRGQAKFPDRHVRRRDPAALTTSSRSRKLTKLSLLNCPTFFFHTHTSWTSPLSQRLPCVVFDRSYIFCVSSSAAGSLHKTSQNGIPLVSLAERIGEESKGEDADQDARYQSKLRTAPLLTQSITTAVRTLFVPGVVNSSHESSSARTHTQCKTTITA